MLRAARDGGAAALERHPELLPVLQGRRRGRRRWRGFLLLLDARAARRRRRAAARTRRRRRRGSRPGRSTPSTAHDAVDGELGVSELRYEVMFFCDLADERIATFKQEWGEIGDSIVVVGGDGIWNCHVHTNDIGAAIEAALDSPGGRSRSG